MVQVVAIGRDVLLGKREDGGQLAGHRGVDVHKVVGHLEDVALLDGVGDGNAVEVDDAVALGGVDREDGVHALVDLGHVALHHGDGRTHEGHGEVLLGGSVGADVGGHDDVALKDVAVTMHLGELEASGQGGKGAVAVGDEADHGRTGAQTAQAADNAQGGGGAAGRLAVGTLDESLDAIGGTLGTLDGGDSHLVGAVLKQKLLGGLTASGGGIKQFEQVKNFF